MRGKWTNDTTSSIANNSAVNTQYLSLIHIYANVSVIAIGTDGKTVRISTNYRIEEEGNNIESEIEAYLYETLKPVLTQNITLETFLDRENHTGGSIISSQTVSYTHLDVYKRQRAPLSTTLKVPKPTNDTLSPAFIALVTDAIHAGDKV